MPVRTRPSSCLRIFIGASVALVSLTACGRVRYEGSREAAVSFDANVVRVDAAGLDAARADAGDSGSLPFDATSEVGDAGPLPCMLWGRAWPTTMATGGSESLAIAASGIFAQGFAYGADFGSGPRVDIARLRLAFDGTVLNVGAGGASLEAHGDSAFQTDPFVRIRDDLIPLVAVMTFDGAVPRGEAELASHPLRTDFVWVAQPVGVPDFSFRGVTYTAQDADIFLASTSVARVFHLAAPDRQAAYGAALLPDGAAFFVVYTPIAIIGAGFSIPAGFSYVRVPPSLDSLDVLGDATTNVVEGSAGTEPLIVTSDQVGRTSRVLRVTGSDITVAWEAMHSGASSFAVSVVPQGAVVTAWITGGSLNVEVRDLATGAMLLERVLPVTAMARVQDVQATRDAAGQYTIVVTGSVSGTSELTVCGESLSPTGGAGAYYIVRVQ